MRKQNQSIPNQGKKVQSKAAKGGKGDNPITRKRGGDNHPELIRVICCESDDSLKAIKAGNDFANSNNFQFEWIMFESNIRDAKKLARMNWIDNGIPCIVYEIDITGKLLWQYEYGK